MKQSLFFCYCFFGKIVSGLLPLLFLLNVKVSGQVLPSTPKTTGIAGIEGPPKVRTISVSTLSGEVVDVKVPNIIMPGDKITGSVASKSQSSTLQGAVVDVENNKSNVKDKYFSFIVPAGLASVPFLLKNDKGETLGKTEIPVDTADSLTPGGNVTIPVQENELPAQQSPGSFTPMNYCQPGQPLTINGFFDGNAANTNVSINNIPCEIIAESPRVSFVQLPEGLSAGQVTINIEEGGVTESMPVQVVTINLSTDKTVIQKNRKATITAMVSGLENLDLNNNNFKMELINGSPAVIEFRNAGTTTLTRDINTGNVKNGTCSFTAEITGIMTGSYTISGTITSTTEIDCWEKYKECLEQCKEEHRKCIDNCDLDPHFGCYYDCNYAYRSCSRMRCSFIYFRCLALKMNRKVKGLIQ